MLLSEGLTGKLEALLFPETLLPTYQTICHHISEDCNLTVRTFSLPVDLVRLGGYWTEKNLGHLSEDRGLTAVAFFYI